MAKKRTFSPRGLRLSVGLNQHDFWTRVGITQSGGSRYESSHYVPKPVQMLLALAYGTAAGAQKCLKLLRAG